MLFFFLFFLPLLGFYMIVKKKAWLYILPLFVGIGVFFIYDPQVPFQQLWKKYFSTKKSTFKDKSKKNLQQKLSSPKKSSSGKKKNSDPKRDFCAREVALPYIMNNLGPKGLTHIYGNPQEASCIVLAFISLSCPICHEVYGEMLKKLQKKASKKNSILCFIKRFYPSDPLAFQLMTLCFSEECLNTTQAMDILDHDFSQWFQKDFFSGEILKTRAIDLLEKHDFLRSRHPKEQNQQQWQQRLFAYYKKDKEHFHIKALPHFYVLMKQKNGQWTTKILHEESTQNILEFFHYLLQDHFFWTK